MPFIHLNKNKIAYEVSGSGDPIVFIHGLGSSLEDWQFQTAYFSQSYKVISYDIRGHGRSEAGDYNYSIKLFTGDCVALLKHLQIDSAHIVGMSLGGLIAFQLAVSYPAMVRSLAIVNSLPEVKLDSLNVKFRIYSRLLLVKLFGMKATGKVLSRKLFIDPGMEKTRKDFIEKWSNNDKKAYLNTVRSMIGWSVKDRLREIKCPVVFISSEFDYTSKKDKEFFVKKIRGARIEVIKNTRHALPYEKPDEFNNCLGVFYDKI